MRRVNVGGVRSCRGGVVVGRCVVVNGGEPRSGERGQDEARRMCRGVEGVRAPSKPSQAQKKAAKEDEWLCLFVYRYVTAKD
jgi:hypothetical protein